MSLRVLSVAYPFAPVGPDAVGGAEQVLSQIDAALVRGGHFSFVAGCRGSVCSGALLSAFEIPSVITDAIRDRLHQDFRELLERAIHEHRIDLVHFHGVDFHRYIPRVDVPMLATLHLPPEWYPPEIFRDVCWLHCVSESQRLACPPGARMLPVIPNGVGLEPRLGVRKRSYTAVLGRICPEKGFHVALDAARRAGVPCFLAGKVFPYQEHLDYFSTQIVPRLDSERRFVGPVGGRGKVRLLTGARCLLVPSLVAETSSLVVMEAMACGTPVIAFSSGALPSLIVDGVTGFVVHDEVEMAEAIRAVETLSAEAPRRYAREFFSLGRMTDSYLALYGTLVSKQENLVSPAGTAHG